MDADNFEKIMEPFLRKPYAEFTVEYAASDEHRIIKCYSAEYVKILRAKITRLENKIKKLESNL